MKPINLMLLIAVIAMVSCAPGAGERIRESPDQPEKRTYELLQPGLSMKTVEEAWGRPDSVEDNCYRDECLIVEYFRLKIADWGILRVVLLDLPF
jgi:hypothetical protein